MYLAVHPAVLSVDVGVKRRVDGCMVKGGVEDARLLCGAAADGYLGEIAVPGGSRGGAGLVEAFRKASIARRGRDVGLEVLPRVLGRDGGDADADKDGVGLALFEIDLGAFVRAVLFAERSDGLNRSAEFGPEINVLPVSPALGFAETGDCIPACLLDVGLQHVVTMLKVYDYLRLSASCKLVSMLAASAPDGE